MRGSAADAPIPALAIARALFFGLTLTVPLTGCAEKGPSIDDAVFIPDPSLPAPKTVSPASPPPVPAKASATP